MNERIRTAYEKGRTNFRSWHMGTRVDDPPTNPYDVSSAEGDAWHRGYLEMSAALSSTSGGFGPTRSGRGQPPILRK